MAFDDDDDPPRLTDPEEIEKARRSLRGMEDMRRRALRWSYLVIAILIVVVIILAYTR